MPARSSASLLAVASAAPATPPQPSLPHSPVANAKVSVFKPELEASAVIAVMLPETAVLMRLVFQSSEMLMSLYGLKTTSVAGATAPPLPARGDALPPPPPPSAAEPARPAAEPPACPAPPP